MDLMLLGETILSDAGSSGLNRDHFGFWLPAGGSDGVAAVEVFRLSTASVYTVTLQTKKSDEADGAASSAGSATIAATGVTKFDVSNAKDLVRYKISYPSGSNLESLHVQLCQPLWAPN